MAGVKLQKFFGKAPKIAPELLPDNGAQVATNIKLYSGDLIPYPTPVIVDNTQRTGTIKRLHALKTPVPTTTTNYTVTVASGTNSYGTGNKFYLNGVVSPTISFVAGTTYVFDQSDASNATHPLRFSTTANGTHGGGNEYTTGVTTFGTAGQAGAYIQITIATGAPTLYYYCINHSGMGGTASILNTNELNWLSWPTDVDIATPSGSTDADEQRFYYTGDGVPKVSTYALATTGSEPYPVDYYDLGLPLPTAVPAAAAASFTTKATTHFARDASGVVTLTTSGAHGLKSGAIATVTGFTHLAGTYSQSGTTITVTMAAAHGLESGAQVVLRFTSGTANSSVYTMTKTSATAFTVTSTTSVSTSGNVEWDMRSFNATSIEVNAPTTTTLTYTSPGFQVTNTAFTDGKIDLAGTIRSRTYVYTWFTPWEEESIGSEPSDALFIREGQIVTVTNLPSAKPTGKNFVRGIRLYRTVVGVTTADYLRVATLWFPTTLANVQRTSNVATVTCAEPHNFAVGDYFKITNCSVASFNIDGGVVTDIPSDLIFTFAQTASDVASTSASGTLYHDSSENPGTDTARYWGESNYSFVDDFSIASLSGLLLSTTYTAPPPTLAGLTTMATGQSNVLAGFVNNEVYFSEPNKFHAWPIAYKISLEDKVVGFAAMSGRLIVMTDAYSYIITGSDPALLSVQRVDARFPCLSKNSIVNTGVGVVYATHDGLALYNTTTGPQLVTQQLYNSDTWNADLDPTTLVANFFEDSYFGGHSAGGIIFSKSSDDRTGGYFVDTTYPFTASWHDNITNTMYYVNGTNGDIFEWDNANQPLSNYNWKSKVIKTPTPINLGAARVVADYTANTTSNWESVTDNWNDSILQWDGDNEVTFKLYVDKVLTSTILLSNSGTFRLPAGYKTDTFEVEVESVVRVRSIQLAETPIGLRSL